MAGADLRNYVNVIDQLQMAKRLLDYAMAIRVEVMNLKVIM